MRFCASSFGAVASVIVVAVSVPALESCGGGTPADALRPKDPSGAAALGESGPSQASQDGSSATCHEVERYGEPLVVDWKPAQRGDLEEAMHDGIAVVAYSCGGLKLLKRCALEGTYGYLGMTKREQVVRLQSADELRANLPLSGLKLAGDISGEMARGATLDIALVTVGKKRTTWKAPSKEDLKGECAGATHFVRGATVGAFAVQTGTRAQVRTTAQVFGAGASGASSSGRDVNDKEGDPAECSKASPDSEQAPAQCGAAVRLELVAIMDARPIASDAPARASEPTRALPVAEEPCPKGLVLVDGKCTPPTEAKPHQCEPGEPGECAKQCDKGHAGSCGALGAIFHGTRELDKALVALKKGCDGGDVRSCVNLGEMHLRGEGTKADPGAAMPLFEKGCSQGDAIGCEHAARAYRVGSGAAKDDARASALFRKACDGGQAHACGELGVMLRDGAGVAKDDKAGVLLLRRACDGNDAKSCNVLGEEVEDRDAIFASIVYQRGCFSQDFKESARACASLGRVMLSGPMKDEGRAKRALEMACNKQNALGCAMLKVAFGDARPVFPDIAEQNALQSACNGGSARACASLGVLQVASGNPVGKSTLERACTMNSAWACAMKAKAH